MQNSEDQWVTGEDLTKARGARGNNIYTEFLTHVVQKPETNTGEKKQFWSLKILKAEHVEHVDFKRFERGGGLEDRKKMLEHNSTYVATLAKESYMFKP